MKKTVYLLPLLLAALIYSCHLGDSVTSGSENGLTFLKLYTVERDSVKFEVYSAEGNSMYYGYNDIGFKVYVSGSEKKNGYVKYYPVMYHALGGPGHSSPVSEKYNYNSDYGLFTGYVCFTMISDSSSYWYADYNYNDTSFVDSVYFQVGTSDGKQLSYWDDVNGGNTYCLTLIKPMSAAMGSNIISFMLHRTNDDKRFYEVDSASMFLKTYYVIGIVTSTGNVNPVWKGNGRYEGSVNLTKSGKWHVQDTIYYNNNRITKTTPPDFILTVN